MSRTRLVVSLVLLVAVVAAGSLAWSPRPQPARAVVRPALRADGSYVVGSLGSGAGSGADTGAERAAVQAAVAAVPPALSYDYASLEESLATATSRMTPAFAAEFRSTFASTVRPMATQEKAVTQARVRAAGVVSASARRVTCLVYVDQVLASSTDLASGKKPVKVGQNRVLVRMVEVGHAWKVDDLTPL